MKHLQNYTHYNESSTFYHKELHPDLWETKNKLKPAVKDKLLNIAKVFVEKNEEIKPEMIKDFVLCGSLANYNWTEGSDLDIHILLDLEAVEMPEGERTLLMALLDERRVQWNLQHEISYHGFPIEIFFENIHDTTRVAVSNGIYSLLNDEWVRKPIFTKPEIDEELINKKVHAYAEKVTYFERLNKSDLTKDEIKQAYEEISKLKDSLLEKRRKSLSAHGEFGTYNLIYKRLRKYGFIDRLWNIRAELYDKQFIQ